jgi:hypothetical protein
MHAGGIFSQAIDGQGVLARRRGARRVAMRVAGHLKMGHGFAVAERPSSVVIRTSVVSMCVEYRP